jgi:hypothetical protein
MYEPDILNVQDSKIYVGFYTARLATIEVSNAEFNVSATETDAPKVDPPQEPVTPNFGISSLDKVSQAGAMLAIPTTVTAEANTNFSVTFLPDDTEYLTSYDKVVKNFTVTMKTYGDGGDIYVSPQGKSIGSGSENDPLDLDTAIDFVKEGQKVIVLDGRYVRHSKLDIKKYIGCKKIFGGRTRNKTDH